MAAKKGRAVQLGPSNKDQPEDILLGLFSKAKTMEWLLELVKKEDAKTIYYTLAGLKLFSEIFGRLGMTKEEKKLFSPMIAFGSGAGPKS